MGQSAGVPIEPDEQSELLDACCSIPGVIGGGVPGGKNGSHSARRVPVDPWLPFPAGGYDAIFVLVAVPSDDPASIDRTDSVKDILSLWNSWTTLAVSPLLSQAEEGGLRFYNEISQVPGLEAGLNAGQRV